MVLPRGRGARGWLTDLGGDVENSADEGTGAMVRREMKLSCK